jgi:prolyl 4-hydroxylase
MPSEEATQLRPPLSTRDLIVPFEGALSLALCREIIERFEQDTRQYRSRTAAGEGTGRQGTMVNMSEPGWEDLKRQVVEACIARMHDYAGRHSALEFILRWEEVQLSSPVIERVGPGQEFPWHIDSGPKQTYQRFLSALTYLNDIEDGGCTEFPAQGLNLAPRAGTMVIFPPFWMFPHRGAPPLKTTKYKMTAYFTIIEPPEPAS